MCDLACQSYLAMYMKPNQSSPAGALQAPHQISCIAAGDALGKQKDYCSLNAPRSHASGA